MFDRLLESRAPHARPTSQTVASVALHLGVVALAAKVMTGAATSLPAPTPDTTIWMVHPAPASRPPAPATTAAAALPAAPTAARIAPLAASPGLDVSSVGLGTPSVDPQAFLSSGSSGSPFASVGGVGEVGGGWATGVYLDAELDQPVEPRIQPRPHYPNMLRNAGVSGYVDLSFVVDTAGRVEPGSIEILSSAHPLFTTSARETIAASTFHPARHRGRAVRQLVRQRVSFRLDE